MEQITIAGDYAAERVAHTISRLLQYLNSMTATTHDLATTLNASLVNTNLSTAMNRRPERKRVD